ncbi:MAG: polysaccharide deacetylase family protein [Xanthomonadales bacterium]|nr:polysaccharide deacetylase family protein [Xanthomonadales bacterium]
MPAIVLTYHSCNITGHEYSSNDHTALEHDLRTIDSQGFQIVSVQDAITSGLSGSTDSVVALTFDDGPIFDFEDFIHPQFGKQKSFARIMREFTHATGNKAIASSFVIASPSGRQQMDEKDYGGRDWWHDRWWLPATESGLIKIENHSWDHNHRAISVSAQKINQRGQFHNIDTHPECAIEVQKANTYISELVKRSPKFFAYPWGQASNYIYQDYMPNIASKFGLEAAFSTQPKAITPHANKWFLPRFVSGEHWKSTQDLQQLLGG